MPAERSGLHESGTNWLRKAWPEQPEPLRMVVEDAVTIAKGSAKQEDMQEKHPGLFQMLKHMMLSPWERRALAYCEMRTPQMNMLMAAAQSYYAELGEEQEAAGFPVKQLMVLQHNTRW